MSKQNGITIVVLVVTIIIMLILVGVTVTTAINGGLLKTSKSSSEETRYSEIISEIEMWESEKKSAERFGIQVETLEEFIDRLKNNKILTEGEASEAKAYLRVTVAEKVIYFTKDKVVADSGLWEYKLQNDQVILTKYKGTGDLLKNVIIPNTLEINGTEYEVIQIGNGDTVANFEESVTISEGITTIGSNAFYGCKNITQVSMPSTIKTIGWQSFRITSSLTQITIPEGTTSIQERAFNASGIKSIVIPGTVETIGRLAFFQSALSEVVICNGVKTIAESAFSESKLKTVIIPGTVKTIGAGAFSTSRSLAELTIEEGVETIGDGAFSDCYSLKNVEIPKSVLTIDDGTFLNCSGLREIKVSNDNPNYTSENGILYNKDKTKIIKYPGGKTDTEFELPSTVIEIGKSCFTACHNLVKIQIPTSVGKLDSNAFVNTSKLQEINVASGNTQYLSESGVLFNKDKTEIIRWPQAKKVTSYAMPNTVKTIKEQCFNKSNVGDLTIPSSAERIEQYAFQSASIGNVICEEESGKGLKEIGYRAFWLSGLKEITLPSTMEKIEGEAFRGCNSLTKITIKKSENSISGKPWNASASVIIEWTGE